MSCLWSCFASKPKRTLGPRILSDPKISNPLNLDDIVYSDSATLKAMEHALVDHLILIETHLTETKKIISTEFRRGASKRAHDALAKRVVLTERKKIYEARLERVRAKLAEIQGSQ